MRFYFIFLMLFFALAARAEDVRSHITYVGASAIYIDIGHEQGIRAGDSIQVMRDGKAIAVLQATFVADHSTSCAVTAATPSLRVGDEAVAFVYAARIKAAEKDTTAPSRNVPLIRKTMNHKESSNRVSGRISSQIITQSDQGLLDFDYSQPSLNLLLNIENLFTTHHTLTVRMNNRRTMRSREISAVTRSQWTGRVYELSLHYDEPISRWNYAIGRVLPGKLRGLNAFDGAQVSYLLNPALTVGALAGTIPDLRTTKPTSVQTQFGAFAAWETKSPTRALSGTLGVIGQYHQGEVSREFLYEQISASPNSKLYLWQSGELNVNRGWTRDRSGSAMQLANVQFSGSWLPHSRLHLTLSVDDRTNYRTWETKDTPDSLFDDSRRQGVRGSLTWRAFSPLRLTGGGGLAWRDATGRAARSGTVGADVNNIVWRGNTWSLNWSIFSNAFIRGSQPSLSLSQSLGGNLLVRAQVGRNMYDYASTQTSVKDTWWKLQADINLLHSLYGGASFEDYQGDSPALRRLCIEVGIRL